MRIYLDFKWQKEENLVNFRQPKYLLLFIAIRCDGGQNNYQLSIFFNIYNLNLTQQLFLYVPCLIVTLKFTHQKYWSPISHISHITYLTYVFSIFPAQPQVTLSRMSRRPVSHITQCHTPRSLGSPLLKGINRREESRAQGRDRHALTAQIVAWITDTGPAQSVSS